MALLRSIKSEYKFYHHQKLDILVALDAKNCKLYSSFWKTNKGKKITALPKSKVTAYKFIFDEEFKSLKIDFSQTFLFDVIDLVKAQ